MEGSVSAWVAESESACGIRTLCIKVSREPACEEVEGLEGESGARGGRVAQVAVHSQPVSGAPPRMKTLRPNPPKTASAACIQPDE